MWILRDITDPEFQKVCGMNSFHGTMNSFHGGMNSGTRWNEFIPSGMNSFYSRVSYTGHSFRTSSLPPQTVSKQKQVHPHPQTESTVICCSHYQLHVWDVTSSSSSPAPVSWPAPGVTCHRLKRMTRVVIIINWLSSHRLCPKWWKAQLLSGFQSFPENSRKLFRFLLL